MAKEKKKTNLLYGIILKSTIEKGKLLSINLPKMDASFIVIDNNDFPLTNRLRFIDNYLPILVKDEISYLGQPILALFGPDYERVEYYLNKIELTYSEVIPTKDQQNLAPITTSWGKDENYFKDENLVKITSTYFSPTVMTKDYASLRVKAWFEDSNLYISSPGQWISHIKDSVAETLGIPKKNIIVDNSKFYAPNDELLTQPSVFAVLAAVAAKKSEAKVELRSPYPISKPEIFIESTTALTKEATPLAEKILVSVDQGAFPILSYELVRHLIAGLTPQYPLDFYSITVTTNSSTNSPANFFGGLGYSTGIASREIHSSNIAKHFGLSNAKFEKINIKKSKNYEKIIKTLPIKRLIPLIDSVCKKSAFERKTAVNVLQQANKLRLRSLLSYSKGIGFASGAGINGFSNQFQYNNLYGIEIILQSKNIVIINSNTQEENSTTLIWKKIIAKELAIKEENIRFMPTSDQKLMDVGPLVLSRDIGSIPLLIKKACQEIKAKQREEEKYPISSVQNLTFDESIAMFDSSVWSTVVVELEIHPVFLYPVVKNCWAHFDFNKVFDKTLLSSSIRKVIETVLTSLGANKDFQLNIELQISDKGTDPPTSVTQIVEGLVTAAFAAALGQALNTEITSFPITSTDILNIIKGNKV